MTLNQTIGTACAEVSASRTAKIAAAAFALAVTFLPLSSKGMDSPPGANTDNAASLLPLPPVPYLDSMQWMKWKPSPPLFKIDTLFAPGIGPGSRFQPPSEYERALPRTS